MIHLKGLSIYIKDYRPAAKLRVHFYQIYRVILINEKVFGSNLI